MSQPERAPRLKLAFSSKLVILQAFVSCKVHILMVRICWPALDSIYLCKRGPTPSMQWQGHHVLTIKKRRASRVTSTSGMASTWFCARGRICLRRRAKPGGSCSRGTSHQCAFAKRPECCSSYGVKNRNFFISGLAQLDKLDYVIICKSMGQKCRVTHLYQGVTCKYAAAPAKKPLGRDVHVSRWL